MIAAGAQRWFRALVWLSALLLVSVVAVAQDDSGDGAAETVGDETVPSVWRTAGGDIGVWIARAEAERFGLLLAQRDEETAGLRRVRQIGEMPELIVGTPEGPLLFFEARGTGDDRLYPVRFGDYEDRAGIAVVGTLDASAPLRTTSELVAGVAAGGDVFLILGSADPDLGAQLLVRDRRDWVPVRLPLELADASRDPRDLRLLSLESGLSILADGAEAGESVLWTLASLSNAESGERLSEWESVTLELDLRGRESFAVGVGDEVLVIAETDGSVEGLVLRRQGAIRFAMLEGAPMASSVASYGGELWLLSDGPDDSIVATVLSRDGSVLSEGELSVGTLRRGEDGLLFLLLVAWSVVISAMVLVLPQNRRIRIVVPPEGYALAEPFRRLLAAIIDLVPGAVLVSMVWDKPAAWWLSPLSEIVSADGSMPIFTLAWATLAYLTLADGLFGRTLGKLLLGCRTVTDAGVAPGLRRGFARSFLKIFCPPLVVVLLLMPYAPAPWSFGTIVVRRTKGEQGAADQDE